MANSTKLIHNFLQAEVSNSFTIINELGDRRGGEIIRREIQHIANCIAVLGSFPPEGDDA